MAVKGVDARLGRGVRFMVAGMTLAGVASTLTSATTVSAMPAAVLAEIRSISVSELGLESLGGVTFDASRGRIVLLSEGASSASSFDASNDPHAEDGLGGGVPAATVTVGPRSGVLFGIDGADIVSRATGAPQRTPAGLDVSDVVAAESDRRTGDWVGLVDGGAAVLLVPALLDGPGGAVRLATPDGQASAVATNPADGLIYLLSGTEVTSMDLQGVTRQTYLLDSDVTSPVDLVIAPSLDLTDSPTVQHLYVVDAPAGQAARLVELESQAAAGGGGAAGDPVTLINTTALSALNPPSPDSAGITYAPNRDRLIVTDSEVDEMGIFQNVNIFEMNRSGTLTDTGVSLPWSAEPTGAGYDTTTNRLLVSDDDANQISFVTAGSDNRYGTSDDSVTSFNVNSTGNADAEDVAYDSSRNRVLVVDGVNNEVYVYSPTGTLITSFDVGVYGAIDPEGIAYDHANDRYLVIDHSSNTLYDLNPDGSLFRLMDVSPTGGINLASVELAPASNGSGFVHYYIVDRGLDNDLFPTENDGMMYEVAPPGGGGPTNQAPTVSALSDFSVALPADGTVSGTASDDGLPSNTLTTTWSETSGPGTATFTDASALTTTVSFSTIGVYVLRLTASDGQLSSIDEVTVSVADANGTLAVDVPIAAGSDDAEQNMLANTVSVNNGDLELGVDFPAATEVPQQVGLRFQAVGIPPASTITSAYVQFTVDEVTNAPAQLTVKGQAADNAAAFAATMNNLSSRPRTTAEVAWTPVAWPTIGAAGVGQQTPSLVSIVQEIVNRPGWGSGNALAFFVDGTGRRTAEAQEGGANFAAVLHVTYQPPVPPPPAPTAPTNMTLATQGADVNIGWTDTATNETSFQVQRARWVVGNWTEFTLLPSVGADVASTVDSNVTPGFYAYLVRAVNGTGNSDWLIAVIQHSNATEVPPAPTDLVPSSSGNDVVLNWTDTSSDEYVQEVGRARFNPTTQTWGEWVFFLADRDATTFTDTNVPDGQYAYLVRSDNKVGPSPWVIAVVIHVNGPGAPAAPSGLTATPAGNAVTLDWTDDATNEVVYEIQRAEFVASAWTNWTSFTIDKNSITFTDSGVAAGHYAYLVRATNPNGSSDWVAVETDV